MLKTVTFLAILLWPLSIGQPCIVAMVEEPPKPEPRKIMARVTYWTDKEPGYYYGKKVAACPKRKALDGRTVAVDPKKIPYDTSLEIPKLKDYVGNGSFVAEDTGSAVKSMRAIPRKKRKDVPYVVDVYVDSLAKMRRLSRTMPHYMEVFFKEEIRG